MALLTSFRSAAAGTPRSQAKPVKWLSLAQLIRTGIVVAQARSFARFTDRREFMAGTPREFYELLPDRAEPADAAGPPGTSTSAVWVDYVSDTGDGFSATFATARCLTGKATPTSEGHGDDAIPGDDLGGRSTPADLLVLGGDEVYPVGSPKNYRDRLNEVLRIAAHADGVTKRPPLVALPGNHDWYDGLAAFRRNFCESQVNREPMPGMRPVTAGERLDPVGGWGAFQSRSYFAVKLAEGWWLWAIDSQLDAPIDLEQLGYFRDAADRVVADKARIILCTAAPSWLDAEHRTLYVAGPDTPLHTLLLFGEQVLGKVDGADQRHRIRLVLTGDQHYYARHTSPTGPMLVTCGGGGAFLSSTHHLKDSITFDPRPWEQPDPARNQRYELVAERCYPSRRISRWLGMTRFLPAAAINGVSLPATLGALDLLVFLSLVLDPARTITPPLLGRPISWQFGVSVLVLLLLLGGYAWSGAKDFEEWPWKRVPLAIGLTGLHTGLHVLVAAAVAGRVGDFTIWRVESPSGAGYLLAYILLAVCGMIVFVAYLQVADSLRCHTLEAFSGLKISGYKCHLRLQVTHDVVTIWAIGITRVPGTWGKTEQRLAEVLPQPHLIEKFEVARDAPDPR